MIVFNEQEQEVINLLDYIPVNSVPGYGIYEILDSGDNSRVKQMLKDLHQQATEAKSTILEQILGLTLLNKIKALYAPANDKLPVDASA